MYRDLSEEEIAAMNKLKELAAEVGEIISQMEDDEHATLDQRWVAIAKTDLQKGFMAVIRAIAQPTSF